MKINIPVQFTGTGQKPESCAAFPGYSFLEITYRRKPESINFNRCRTPAFAGMTVERKLRQ
ncbi:MAG: hypothetical protein AB7S75_10545 [Desulfococcaceae bacterium]